MRKEVKLFAEVMEAKLAKNDHKGGWTGCSGQFLWSKLLEELAEFNTEFRKYPIPGSRTERKKWRERVLNEAADVANICMMLVDIMGALQESKEAGDVTDKN